MEEWIKVSDFMKEVGKSRAIIISHYETKEVFIGKQKLLMTNRKEKEFIDKRGKIITEARLKACRENGKKGGGSFKGKHHSNETKERISKAKKGCPSWNKGKKLSEEAINKMKESKKKINEQNQILIDEYRNNGYITSKDASEILGCGITTFERFYRNCVSLSVCNKHLWKKDVLENSPLINMKSKGTSHYENEIADFLKENNISFTQNNRSVIKHYELDFYINEYNLAIEFDGLYWHSEEHKEKYYHLNKTLACENQNIRLIHIFEDEWNFKKEIVKSMILAACGKFERKIFARKCEVKRLDKKDALEFIQQNHIQNTEKELSDSFGLIYNNELVQVCTFRKNFAQRKNKDLELARMCSKLNTQVIGGFSKIMKYAMNELHIDKVTSFVDRRLFDAKGYKASDWKIVGESAPSFFYTDFITRDNRLNYTKEKCLEIWPDADKNSTEKQICNDHGLFRIYDCGCIKLELYK